MDDPQQFKIDILLPRLSAHELSFLISWAGIKAPQWPVFTEWLCRVCVDELERRQTAGGCEPEMLALPVWSGAQLADALVASYVLSRSPHTDGLAEFIEQVARRVVSAASAALETFHEGIQI